MPLPLLPSMLPCRSRALPSVVVAIPESKASSTTKREACARDCHSSHRLPANAYLYGMIQPALTDLELVCEGCSNSLLQLAAFFRVSLKKDAPHRWHGRCFGCLSIGQGLRGPQHGCENVFAHGKRDSTGCDVYQDVCGTSYQRVDTSVKKKLSGLIADVIVEIVKRLPAQHRTHDSNPASAAIDVGHRQQAAGCSAHEMSEAGFSPASTAARQRGARAKVTALRIHRTARRTSWRSEKRRRREPTTRARKARRTPYTSLPRSSALAVRRCARVSRHMVRGAGAGAGAGRRWGRAGAGAALAAAPPPTAAPRAPAPLLPPPPSPPLLPSSAHTTSTSPGTRPPLLPSLLTKHSREYGEDEEELQYGQSVTLGPKPRRRVPELRTL